MSLKNYPGPVKWLDEAAAAIPHAPSDPSRAKNLDGFSTFSDLIGQACGQTDPSIRASQIEAAQAQLAPIRIAIRAAESILAAVRPTTTTTHIKTQANR